MRLIVAYLPNLPILTSILIRPALATFVAQHRLQRRQSLRLIHLDTRITGGTIAASGKSACIPPAVSHSR
jgi:hypothetical protein